MEELALDRVIGQQVRIGDAAVAPGLLVQLLVLFEYLLEGLPAFTYSFVLNLLYVHNT